MSTNEIDWRLTEYLSMELNGVGDADTVSGRPLEQQEVVVRILNLAMPLKGEAADANMLREFEADVESILDDSTYFEPPWTITAFQDDEQTIRATIDTGETTFVTPNAEML